MLKIWSCAIGLCESCQVGNQAALSSPPCVPQGCRFGAGCPGNGCSIHSEKGVQSCHASCRKNSGLIWARSFLYSSRFIRGSGRLSPPAESRTFYLKISENSQHLRGRQRHRPLQTATQLHSCQSGGPVPITNCVWNAYRLHDSADTAVSRRTFARQLCAFLTKRQMFFSCAQIFCRKSRFLRKHG